MFPLFTRKVGGAIPYDPPGSQSFTTAGAHNFQVPNFENELTITLWGGGGAGGSVASTTSSDSGEASTVASLSLSANGGGGGEPNGWSGGTSPIPGGAGGTATGGDINATGSVGNQGRFSGSSSSQNGAGGAAASPGGGNGGSPITSSSFQNGNVGTAPGGGGSGGGRTGNPIGSGGGGGGRCQKTFQKGQIVPGTILALIVGSGGVAPSASGTGGPGAVGRINISWS